MFGFAAKDGQDALRAPAERPKFGTLENSPANSFITLEQIDAEKGVVKNRL